MENFFVEASLPEDLIVFIRKTLKNNWDVNRAYVSYVDFPENYRRKLEKLLPEIVKYYGPKGWDVRLEDRD